MFPFTNIKNWWYDRPVLKAAKIRANQQMTLNQVALLIRETATNSISRLSGKLYDIYDARFQELEEENQMEIARQKKRESERYAKAVEDYVASITDPDFVTSFLKNRDTRDTIPKVGKFDSEVLDKYLKASWREPYIFKKLLYSRWSELMTPGADALCAACKNTEELADLVRSSLPGSVQDRWARELDSRLRYKLLNREKYSSASSISLNINN